MHIDTKKLGRFERTGHRASGDRTGQSKSRGIGWEVVHLAIVEFLGSFCGTRRKPLRR